MKTIINVIRFSLRTWYILTFFIIMLIVNRGEHILASIIITLLIGGLAYFFTNKTKATQTNQAHGLTRKEMRYISSNLTEARKKIIKLQKVAYRNKTIPCLKGKDSSIKINKQIYGIVNQDPKRFFTTEAFFFSHLDSMVELVSRYDFLVSQPFKDEKMTNTLVETEKMILEMDTVIRDDLFALLNKDVETLDYEVEVARHAVKNKQNSK